MDLKGCNHHKVPDKRSKIGEEKEETPIPTFRQHPKTSKN